MLCSITCEVRYTPVMKGTGALAPLTGILYVMAVGVVLQTVNVALEGQFFVKCIYFLLDAMTYAAEHLST